MANSPEELASEVKALVDSNSLYQVLEALVNLCSMKDEHIRVHGQDARLAGDWNSVSERLAGVLWKTPENL